jgi:hypothetical protein
MGRVKAAMFFFCPLQLECTESSILGAASCKLDQKNSPYHPTSSHNVRTCSFPSARLPNVKSLGEIQSNANESRGHELLRFHVTKLQGIEEDLVGQ